jgi:hypothetical protein
MGAWLKVIDSDDIEILIGKATLKAGVIYAEGLTIKIDSMSNECRIGNNVVGTLYWHKNDNVKWFYYEYISELLPEVMDVSKILDGVAKGKFTVAEVRHLYEVLTEEN